MSIVTIILSGGKGKRLWPVSRETSPKQFHSLVEKESLLQSTIKRAERLKQVSDLILICNESQRFLVDKQVKEIKGKEYKIILEPTGKNTAPAIVSATLYVDKNNYPKDTVLLVLPSDHLLEDEKAFQKVVSLGHKAALENKIVTFGVKPTEALTGYGYIKKLNKSSNEISEIEEFIEKPSLLKAKSYIKDESFLWNSGIFMFKPDTLLSEFSHYSKSILKACNLSVDKAKEDLNFIRLDKKEFEKNPSRSIDKVIMEKTKNSVVIPLNTNWIDLGSWSSIHKVSKRDKNNNVLLGKVYSEQTKNSYIRSDTRTIASIGMDGAVIIDTPDILLISSMKDDQNVKQIAEKFIKESDDEHTLYEDVHRPWGTYTVVDKGKTFLVKRLKVNPGARLSLQKHSHRAEHWVVVKGKAKVTCGEETFILNKNESTFIPIGFKHRLENPTSNSLEIIEVQSGTYLREDDIERLEDQYGR